MRPLIYIALVCLISCKAQRPLGEPVEGLVLLQDDGYSGISEFGAHAIQEQKVLEHHYAQINRTRKPGLPLPDIDFGTEMALLIFLGEQQGTKKVRVSKVAETGTEMVLAVEIGEDPENNKAIDAGTLPILQPFYLYKMPLSEKRIVFKKVDLEP